MMEPLDVIGNHFVLDATLIFTALVRLSQRMNQSKYSCDDATQEAFLGTIRSEGAWAKSVAELFQFRRPLTNRGKASASSALQMSEKQLDIM